MAKLFARQLPSIFTGKLAVTLRRLFGDRRFLLVLFLIAVQIFLVGSSIMPPAGHSLCGGGAIYLDGLAIENTSWCQTEQVWHWSLSSAADANHLTLSPKQQYNVTFSVATSAQAESSYHLIGQVRIRNLTAFPVAIASLRLDQAPMTCSMDFPYKLGPFQSMNCEYQTTLASQPSLNSLEVARQNSSVYRVSGPLNWPAELRSHQVVDECIMLTREGDPGQKRVCAGEQQSFTLSNSLVIGPFAGCGEHTVGGLFSYTAGDSGASGSAEASVRVTVPCDGGCTLPVAYWRDHAANGSGLYDVTWDFLDGGEAPFLGSNRSYLQVIASTPEDGNLLSHLSQAYIAAELNRLQGAAFPAKVAAAFEQAASLLTKYQAASIITNKVDESLAVYLDGILTGYNQGVNGPVSCSE